MSQRSVQTPKEINQRTDITHIQNEPKIRTNQRLERIKDQNVTKYGCKDTKKTSIIKR